MPGKPRILRRPRPPSIGWREWVALPDLGIPAIKVKVDTGARSSALHAFDIRRRVEDGVTWVEFKVHPIQRDVGETVRARAALADERVVRSSSGKATRRAVIATRVVIGSHAWPIEVTLVRRDLMGFRMLLGRQAVRGRFLVHPGRSFLLGEPAALLGGSA